MDVRGVTLTFYFKSWFSNSTCNNVEPGYRRYAELVLYQRKNYILLMLQLEIWCDNYAIELPSLYPLVFLYSFGHS